MLKRYGLSSLLVALLALGAVACTNEPVDRPTSTKAIKQLSWYVGKPLANAESVADARTEIIIDLSNFIGKTPTYGTAAAKAKGIQYSVVAVCSDTLSLADSRQLHVAVVPTSDMSVSVRKGIESGKFRKGLTCNKGEKHKA